eukprot:gene14775-17461_t
MKRLGAVVNEDSVAAERLASALGADGACKLAAAVAAEEARIAALDLGGDAALKLKDLRIHALTESLPFLGFGFVDNLIMILAGEYIDMTIGLAFGLSTMAAAGLGNTLSDVAGVGLGGTVSMLVDKLGLPKPNFTRLQEGLPRVRFYAALGQSIGITIGCIIGMFPLLFITGTDEERKQAELESMLDALVSDLHVLLGADHSRFWLADRGKNVYRSVDSKASFPLHEGVPGEVFSSGKLLNISASGTEVCQNIPGCKIQNVLCVPLFDGDGAVFGVVEVLNKRDGPFTRKEEEYLALFCSNLHDDVLRATSEENTKSLVKDSLLRMFKEGTLP